MATQIYSRAGILLRCTLPLLVWIGVASCGGASGSDEQSSATSPNSPTPHANGAWDGRAWDVRNNELYFERWADTQPTFVDKELKPAPRSNIPVPVLSKNGQYYIVYASDYDVSVTDFSVRRTSDAKAITNFWSSRYTGSVAISNSGRFVAWKSAVDHNAYLAGGYDLRVLDTQPEDGGDIRQVGAWSMSSSVDGLLVQGFDWTWDDGLLIFASDGAVRLFSPLTSALTKIGQLPSQHEGRAVLFGSSRINSMGNKLAGVLDFGDQKTEVWVANIDGSGMKQHTQVGGFISVLAWSPDGNYLHAGDCRTAFGFSNNAVNIGKHSWIAPASMEKLNATDIQAYIARYKEELSPNTLGCGFMWTP